ncbi:MAG: hypothetical protein U0Q15_14530 [Kineosporiaceae bacterium]
MLTPQRRSAGGGGVKKVVTGVLVASLVCLAATGWWLIVTTPDDGQTRMVLVRGADGRYSAELYSCLGSSFGRLELLDEAGRVVSAADVAGRSLRTVDVTALLRDVGTVQTWHLAVQTTTGGVLDLVTPASRVGPGTFVEDGSDVASDDSALPAWRARFAEGCRRAA